MSAPAFPRNRGQDRRPGRRRRERVCVAGVLTMFTVFVKAFWGTCCSCKQEIEKNGNNRAGAKRLIPSQARPSLLRGAGLEEQQADLHRQEVLQRLEVVVEVLEDRERLLAGRGRHAVGAARVLRLVAQSRPCIRSGFASRSVVTGHCPKGECFIQFPSL